MYNEDLYISQRKSLLDKPHFIFQEFQESKEYSWKFFYMNT